MRAEKELYGYRIKSFIELFIGRIPESDGYHGQCILHRCDTILR